MAAKTVLFSNNINFKLWNYKNTLTEYKIKINREEL